VSSLNANYNVCKQENHPTNKHKGAFIDDLYVSKRGCMLAWDSTHRIIEMCYTIKNNHVFYNKECSRIEIKFEEKIVGKNCIQTNLSLIKHI